MFCCRGTSIKTRIETQFKQIIEYEIACCRGTSIKTRIETLYVYLELNP